MSCWRRLFGFFAANVVFASGLFFHAFLYNFYIEELGSSPAVMGMAASSLTLGGLLSLLPAGLLVDRMGPRAVAMIGSGVAALGLAWGAIVQRPEAIYTAAALAGIGTSLWRVAISPLLMRLADPDTRSRAFSWNVGLMVGAGGIWLAAAGSATAWLQDVGSIERVTALRAALLLGAAGTAASAAIFATIGESGQPGGRASGSVTARGPGLPWSGFGAAPFLLIIGLVAVWMTAPALVQPFFNIYFARVHDLPVDRIGFIFGLSHGVTAVVIFGSGELAARLGLFRMLALWTLLFGPALWALTAATAVSGAIALYFVQGIISPATNPLIDQILLERAPDERRGAVSAWRNVATEGGGALGAALGGVVLAKYSFAALFVGAGALGCSAAIGLLVGLRRVPLFASRA